MPINENHIQYYQYLESLRRSGIVNIWGAAPYLKREFTELSYNDAKDILLEWIHNYDKLNERFGWR